MELRQLRYHVAIAQESNFGRCRKRFHIAGPSSPPRSQQIKKLERDQKVQPFACAAIVFELHAHLVLTGGNRVSAVIM